MCGRYTLAGCEEFDPAEFGLSHYPSNMTPRYNIAPMQVAPVVPNRAPRQVGWLRWGLIPSWAKDGRIASRLINARAETITERPAFREAFRRRRCLVLADGFYEWRREGRQRIPFYVRRRDRRVFAFAGLWETWRSPEGGILETFAIITTAANAVVAPIHDRMPVILPRDAYDPWLTTSTADPAEFMKWLRPCPDDLLEAYEVSPVVNAVSRDDPTCIVPSGRSLF